MVHRDALPNVNMEEVDDETNRLSAERLLRYDWLTLYSTGRCVYSAFIVDDVACPRFNAELFPFDQQVCYLTLRSSNSRFASSQLRRWTQSAVTEASVSGDWSDTTLLMQTLYYGNASVLVHRLLLERSVLNDYTQLVRGRP